MEFPGILGRLGLLPGEPAASELLRALSRELSATGAASAPVPRHWLMLAAALARLVVPGAGNARTVGWPAWDQVPAPLVLGISGGQGSGKTTLARALVCALRLAGARAAACSLDDFYLTRAERLALAEAAHPLLATRGVPGTHDVALLERTIELLGGTGTVSMPVFDKAADDRAPRERWQPLRAPLDVLVLEGWCVGAVPQSAAALADPVNELEACEDPHGRWRRHANEALAGPYARLWRRLHGLVYLQVPDMQAVGRWRADQERDLPAHRRMSQAQLERFIAHYERLTRAMRQDLPARADVVVELAEDHSVASIRRNGAARAFRVHSAISGQNAQHDLD